MESLKFYLNETNPKSDTKRQLFFGITGAVYLAIGLIIILKPFSGPSIFYILGGVITLGYAIIYRKVIKRRYISLDDTGVTSRVADKFSTFPKYKELEIKWGDIESVAASALKVRFKLKNGNTQEMELGDLLYKEHQEFKQRLEEYIELKKIKTA